MSLSRARRPPRKDDLKAPRHNNRSIRGRWLDLRDCQALTTLWKFWQFGSGDLS
ncbi:hypothetical protein Ae717Ps2_6840 [Pseudonocardia sp. Ae717_Ps2]|nr:hypothetical protein Ae717Ps2_6840 [Pseudonocardia sp. Ae717_Ps2]